MKNTYQTIIIGLLFCLSLCSCFKDPIDLDLNENNEKLAVEAWINTLDEEQYVILRKTANFLGDDPYQMVSGAVVNLSNDQGQDYSLTETEPGFYRVPEDWEPMYESLYTLDIETTDEKITAEHKLREAPLIENLKIDEYFNEEDSLIGYQTLFSIQDTPGLGDAYYVIDYEKHTLFGDTILNGEFADDEFFDGNFVEDISITDEDRLFQIGDTAVVEVYAIGKSSSKFLIDVELEVFRGGPFDPPAANVRTNFDGDVVGYFIMSGAERKEIEVF